MPVTIKDAHLEEQIDAERQRRGDRTMAKTLGDLAREVLTQLETERRERERQQPTEAASPAA